MARLPNFLVIIRSEKLSGKGQGRGVGVRKKERFVLGKRTFRSQKSKHFVLRIIDGNESWTGYNYRKLVSLTPYQGWQSVEDYPIIRYAEVLLTYAEARVQNNGWDEKVQHALNDLRDRCGMPNVPNSLSKDAALELVRNERRIELAAEGHRYDDIRRYGLEYCREAMNGESTAPCGGFDPVKKEWQKYVVIDKVWGDRLLLMPIPTSAMDVNPLLKDDQNPGY